MSLGYFEKEYLLQEMVTSIEVIEFSLTISVKYFIDEDLLVSDTCILIGVCKNRTASLIRMDVGVKDLVLMVRKG